MRYIYKVFVMSVFFSTTSLGCGTSQGSGLNIDTEVAPYFNQFKQDLVERDVNIPIRNLTITIDDTLKFKTSAAYCEVYGYKAPEIHIRRSDWERYSSLDREAVLYHELGHCILGRDHNAEFQDNPFEGAQAIHGGIVCAGITYQYDRGAGRYMPESMMHPCSNASSNLYASRSVTPKFRDAMRTYYINELIGNRVEGFDSNFK